jgi:inner membrane protein
LASFATICAYILANGFITGRAEQLTAQAVQKQHKIVPTLVVANPVPVQFWKREMLWRDDSHYGQGTYTPLNGARIDDVVRAHYMGPEDAKAFETHIVRGSPLLFWSRMPVAEIVGEGTDTTLKVSDQRFSDPLVGDRFSMFFPIGVESK